MSSLPPRNDEPQHATSRKQQVSGVFDRAATSYGQIGPGYFAHFGRRLVELAQLPEGAAVLDVATGRGAVLLPAAEAAGPRGRVTGIDFAPAMVQATAGELRRRGVANAAVQTMDAEHLDFPDESFDIVLCGFAIFFFPQLDRAMAELRRVLKPGGRIGVTTWGDISRAERQWFQDLVAAYLPPAPQVELPAQDRRPIFDQAEGVGDILRAAGFADVDVVSEVVEFVYASKEELWSTLWTHGTRGPLERLEQVAGVEGMARFKAEVLARADTIAQTDGIHEQFHVLYGLATRPPNEAAV